MSLCVSCASTELVLKIKTPYCNSESWQERLNTRLHGEPGASVTPAGPFTLQTHAAEPLSVTRCTRPHCVMMTRNDKVRTQNKTLNSTLKIVLIFDCYVSSVSVWPFVYQLNKINFSNGAKLSKWRLVINVGKSWGREHTQAGACIHSECSPVAFRTLLGRLPHVRQQRKHTC